MTIFNREKNTTKVLGVRSNVGIYLRADTVSGRIIAMHKGKDQEACLSMYSNDQK